MRTSVDSKWVGEKLSRLGKHKLHAYGSLWQVKKTRESAALPGVSSSAEYSVRQLEAQLHSAAPPIEQMLIKEGVAAGQVGIPLA